MTTISLAGLMTIESQEDYETRIASELQEAGFPVTDWADGGIAKTLVASEAAANATFSAQQVIVARAGYLTTAAQAGDDWLTLKASQDYQTDRYADVKTSGRVSVYCDAANGPYSITAGLLRWSDANGHRYINTTTGTLSPDSSMDLVVQAESGGTEYNIANGALLTLETGLPGVSLAKGTGVLAVGTSPAVTYTGVYHPTDETPFVILITTGGARGVARFKYSINGGLSYAIGTELTDATFASGGLTISFATGTYVAGDRYYFVTNPTSYNPGPVLSWITVSGADEESNERLIRRCQTKWATLGYGQNDDWYEHFATTGHAYADSVTRAKIETMAPYTTAAKYAYDTPDLTVGGAPADQTLSTFVAEIDAPGALGVATFKWSVNGGTETTGVATGTAIPLGSTGCALTFADATYVAGQKWRWSGCYGGVLATIATATGGASSTIVDAVQAWFNVKTMSRVLVESALEEVVNITVNVIASTAVQSTLQTLSQAAIDALFEDRALGQPLYRAEIIAAIMANGAKNVEVAVPGTDLNCGSMTVLTQGTTTFNFTWV